MVFQMVWIRADADFINLTLDLKRKVVLGAVSTLLTLALAALLIRWLDDAVVGLCLGFILGRTILSIGYPFILGRVFGVPLHWQLVGLIRPALVTIGLFAMTAWLSMRVEVNSWPSLAVFAAASFAVLGMTAFLAGLSDDRRIAVQARIRQIVSGRVGG